MAFSLRYFFCCLIFFGLLSPALANDDFYRGVDLSYVNEMEDCGATYHVNGEPKDPYEIFADRGSNIVRVRLWHSPDWTEYSDFSDVKETISRSKQAAMKVLLDIHYSDNWADGEHQIIPKAWAHITDLDKLVQTIYRYTYDLLVALHQEGLMPDMVQVGNETNGEIMMLQGEKNYPINWTRNAKLFNAGIQGVRDAGAKTGTQPAVMLHIAQPENVEPWFEAAQKSGITDFDFIGISYYSKWSEQSIRELAQTINRLRYRHNTQVIVVETAYPWTTKYTDSAHNMLGKDALIKAYPATRYGQKKYLLDLTQAVATAGGAGLIYWEPAWVSTKCKTRWGQGSHWENATLFDFENNNEILPGIDFLNYPYDFPVMVTFRFIAKEHANIPETIYFWGDFIGSNKYLIPIKHEQGVFTYQTRLAKGDKFRYQVFSSPQLSTRLIEDVNLDKDGFATFVVSDTQQTITRVLHEK